MSNTQQAADNDKNNKSQQKDRLEWVSHKYLEGKASEQVKGKSDKYHSDFRKKFVLDHQLWIMRNSGLP